MTFVKVLKNSSWFAKYQTKYRRRREGKTDYRARRTLVNQDKTKFNVAKIRFIVRITNKDVICQLAVSKIIGDFILESAYAHELQKFGLKVPNLTNYAACYATGLLLARRWLTKLGKAAKFAGTTDVSGKHYLPDEADGERPKKALLDVGLRRTTRGARVFGSLKGAADGGLYVPHREKRFPGFDKEKGELDSEKHRQRIFGVHVAQYQQLLQGEDEQRYKTVFSAYVKAGVAPDAIEGMWKNVHASIRKDPARAKKKEFKGKAKDYSQPSLTTEGRQAARLAKKEGIIKALLED